MPDYRNAASGAGLEMLLKGLQPLNELGDQQIKQKNAIALQQQAANIKKAADEADLQRAIEAQKNLPVSPYGGKGGVKSGSADISATMPNTYQIEDRAIGEFGKTVRTDKNYQTIHDRIDAANNALTQLQMGNSFSDKMAMLPEIRAAMGSQGVSRIYSEFQKNSKTSGDSVANFFNYLNNNADPTIQTNVRNAMQDSIIGTANNYLKQYQTYKQSASQKAQETHGLRNPAVAVNNTFMGDDMLSDDLTSKMNNYAKQKAAAAAPTGSNPAAVSASNPPQSTLGQLFSKVKSTVGGLGNMLGGTQSAPQNPAVSSSQPAQMSQDPGMARYQELLKKQQQGQ